MSVTLTYELPALNTLRQNQTGYNRNTSTLAGITTAQLQQYLADAQAAKHAIMTGSQPVEIAYTQGDGSKSVKRQMTSLAQINAYIQELQLQLGMIQSARRPVRPIYR